MWRRALVVAALVVAALQTGCDARGRTRLFATLGVARAQFELGLAYEEGRGEAQSYAEAADWYRKATASGQRDAQYRLAVLYARGHGVEQDLLEAERLLNGLVAVGDQRAVPLRIWVREQIIARAQREGAPSPEIAL